MVQSVDRALRMLKVLGAQGPLGVSALAHQVEIAPSTAHRLLATMVDQGFAVQTRDRKYDVGPALLKPGASRRQPTVAELVRPYLEQLFDLISETVHLQRLVGQDVVFLDGIESGQNLRAGIRTGVRMPAWRTSGGRAMLADLDPDNATSIRLGGGLPRLTSGVKPGTQRQADTARRWGLGINQDEAELGVTAVSRSIGFIQGKHCAMTVSAPTARVTLTLAEYIARHLSSIAERAKADLQDKRRPA